MANGNFNIPPTDIRVLTADVGGSFGMKSGVQAEYVSHKPLVNAAISMALGCSIMGPVDPRKGADRGKVFEAGVDLVAIADTVGYAGPKQVGELTQGCRKDRRPEAGLRSSARPRGVGIANASAALDAGARILDGSLGGLGGCPFAPGATGNVVFEDLVFLCESKGFATGIDIEKLIAVRGILSSEMPDETLYGGHRARRVAGRNGGEGGVTCFSLAPLLRGEVEGVPTRAYGRVSLYVSSPSRSESSPRGHSARRARR